MGMQKPFWSKVQELQSCIRDVAALSTNAGPQLRAEPGFEVLADQLAALGVTGAAASFA